MAKQTFTTGQVLTAAQLTSLQQTAMLGGAASAKTANYTLVAADAGTAISMSSTSATTITVNTGLFAAGDTIQITNLNTGVCTITAGTATVNTSASLALAQYESGTLAFTSASAAIFIKGAGAAAAGGGMTSIASGSLSGSSVVLGSIPTTYNQLFLELKDHYPAANGYGVDVIITGVTSNYKGIYIYNQSSSGVGVTTTTTFSREAAYALNNADNNNYMGLWLINYASSVRKIANVFGSFYTNGAVNYITNSTVYHDTTAAITSLTIGLEGGTATTFAGGTYTLWGIK